MVRHIDLWTITRVSLLFNIVVGIMFLIAGVLLWRLVIGLSFVGKAEGLVGKLAGGTFRIKGDSVFWIWFVIVCASTAFFTGMSTLLAMLYNLIADTVGGVSFEIEDRVVKRDRLMHRAFASMRGGADDDTPARARPGSTPPPRSGAQRKPVQAKPGAPGDAKKPAVKTSGSGAGSGSPSPSRTAASAGTGGRSTTPAGKSAAPATKTQPAPVQVASDDVIPAPRRKADPSTVAPVPKPKK